jgi:hypothetical protein
MKQIFTLLTALSITAAASAQNISEGFNTSAEVTALATSCWNFNSVNFSTSSAITGTGSMISQLGVTSEIITPELVMPSSITISFKYFVAAEVNGAQKIQVLLTNGVTETKLYDQNPSNSGSGTISVTLGVGDPLGANVSGNKKVVIRISNNLSLRVDDLSINAPYRYINGCPFENAALPVTLLSFQGSLAKDQAQLNWSVADNETGNYFEVQRSLDSKNFSTVAVVSTTQKQGDEVYSYKEAAQPTAYYRLKIVNKDRSVSYSKVLLIKTQATSNNSTLALLQNPVQQTLAFSFTSSNSTSNEIAVYNLVGLKVYAQKLGVQKGNNSVSLQLNNNLNPGTYILEVKNNSERTTTKFIKQ